MQVRDAGQILGGPLLRSVLYFAEEPDERSAALPSALSGADEEKRWLIL